MSECLITSLEVVLAMDHSVSWRRNVLLYQSLGSNFRTVILTAWDRNEAKRWMLNEHVRYDLLIDKGTSILTDQAWKVSQVHEIMGMGWPIGLYLDTDPAVIQEVLAMGLTTLLVSFKVKRPNWMPAHTAPRAWDDLVAFLDEQRDADGEAFMRREVDEVRSGSGHVWTTDVRRPDRS